MLRTAAGFVVAVAGLAFIGCADTQQEPEGNSPVDGGTQAQGDAGQTGDPDGGSVDSPDGGGQNASDGGSQGTADGGSQGTADGGPVAGGRPRALLVATSYVPRLIDLATGATTEAHADKLRWRQSPGHLYPHFDISPDGTTMVVYHEYGTNAPTGDDRLVLYALDGSGAPKVLAKRTATFGEFPAAPCFRADGKILVLAQDAVWAVDSALDHTQAPTRIAGVNPGDKMRSPAYWNRDCTALATLGFKAGDTNSSATNVAHLDAATGTLTQISTYETGGKTLAQQANHPTCTGSGCTTAMSGGTIGSMGWLADGSIYFKSNRDVWRDNVGWGNNQGQEKILRYDPAAPKTFDQLETWTGPRPHAISRDGSHFAVVNGSTVEIFKADGTKVVTSTDDFNAANAPGFMRFVP